MFWSINPVNKEQEKEAFLQALKENKYDKVTHKVFADWLEEHGFDDEALVQREWTKEKQEAEDWLRDFADKIGNHCTNYNNLRGEEGDWQKITYEDVIQAGHNFVNSNGSDYFIQYGSEKARSVINSGNNKKLFWKYWQIITNKEVSKSMQGTIFSCSC